MSRPKEKGGTSTRSAPGSKVPDRAGPAAAAQVAACASNANLDSKVHALWITDKANPDEAPCVARLSPISCSSNGSADTRVYASPDGAYRAILRVTSGAVTVSIQVNASGVGRGAATLATYPYQRAVFRGIGVDGVQMFDEDAQTTKTIGNVMLIPTENLTENGQAMCPAR